MLINPKCPKCSMPLRISKIENDKWICKQCNEIFNTEEVDVKGTWYERLRRYRGIEELARR